MILSFGSTILHSLLLACGFAVVAVHAQDQVNMALGRPTRVRTTLTNSNCDNARAGLTPLASIEFDDGADCTYSAAITNVNYLKFCSGDLAVDGDVNNVFEGGSCFHSNGSANQFWEVDLGKDEKIESVVLYNRNSLQERQNNLIIELRDDPFPADGVPDAPSPSIVATHSATADATTWPDDIYTYDLPTAVKARYVALYRNPEPADKNFHLCEVEVYGSPKKGGNKKGKNQKGVPPAECFDRRL